MKLLNIELVDKYNKKPINWSIVGLYLAICMGYTIAVFVASYFIFKNKEVRV